MRKASPSSDSKSSRGAHVSIASRRCPISSSSRTSPAENPSESILFLTRLSTRITVWITRKARVVKSDAPAFPMSFSIGKMNRIGSESRKRSRGFAVRSLSVTLRYLACTGSVRPSSNALVILSGHRFFLPENALLACRSTAPHAVPERSITSANISRTTAFVDRGQMATAPIQEMMHPITTLRARRAAWRIRRSSFLMKGRTAIPYVKMAIMYAYVTVTVDGFERVAR
mmetsp:Transcript_18463/g.28264  ORF Transcript_18463/g.28264 Transcript_18463/m.28264 type:complete len:229 (-) Transcript_18463:450-1136(-)